MAFVFMSKVTFPARFEFLDEIRDLVARVAREGGFTEKEIYSLQLAADEAASNIIEHAYEGVKNAALDMNCEMRGDTIVITMHDTGKPFDLSTVKQPDIHANLSEREIGGLGVFLIRKLMDDVFFESNSKTGNQLTMTKRRG
jgi:serine/threonine-protein kinase RsbW